MLPYNCLLRLLKFVIDAYNLLNDKACKLVIISSGRKKSLNVITDYIKEKALVDKVVLLSDLPYKDLVTYYLESICNIIPLRENNRDRARFPHKIGEYTASSRPMLTNEIGDIPYYFVDEVSALITKNFDEAQYAEKMNWIFDKTFN